MQVILKLENLEKVQAKLKELEVNLTNTKPLLEEFGIYLDAQAKDSFNDEKDWNNVDWNPLASSTLALKQKKRKPTNILRYDGGLQGKLIVQYEDNSVSISTNATTKKGFLYPSVMQFGTTNAGRNKKVEIPARPFLPINLDGSLYKGVEDELVEITVEFIDTILKK